MANTSNNEAMDTVEGSFDEKVVYESGLRGYFTVDEPHHAPGTPKRRRKNVDFLRLKDLHCT